MTEMLDGYPGRPVLATLPCSAAEAVRVHISEPGRRPSRFPGTYPQTEVMA